MNDFHRSERIIQEIGGWNGMEAGMLMVIDALSAAGSSNEKKKEKCSKSKVSEWMRQIFATDPAQISRNLGPV